MEAVCPHTKRALLAQSLLNEPLNALYTLLPVILYKGLGADPLQLSLFLALRPMLSLFSFYWSFRPKRLVPNLIGAILLARLPFLLLLPFPNIYVLFLACSFYQLFSKAGTPAWIEILNRKIAKGPREHLFTVYNTCGFIEGILLSLFIGTALDVAFATWTLFFAAASLLGMLSLFFLTPIATTPESAPSPATNTITHPWRAAFKLLSSRPDFAKFQWGFMFGGGSLMLMAPALSVFYVDALHVSYTEISTARFVCMGVGVLLTSLLWREALRRLFVDKLLALILVGFALFPTLLLVAQIEISFLYIAFFVYGIFQAGSHLVWNLSGTLFAKEESSLPFTNVNLLMLGLRGCLLPVLGGLLCEWIGAGSTLILGISLLLLGTCYMISRIGGRKDFC